MADFGVMDGVVRVDGDGDVDLNRTEATMLCSSVHVHGAVAVNVPV